MPSAASRHRRVQWYTLPCVVSLLACHGAAAFGQQRMTIKDLLDVRTLSGPYGAGEVELSPDGSRVAYVVHRPFVEQNRIRTELWVTDVRANSASRLVEAYPLAMEAVSVRPQWTQRTQRLSYLCSSGRDNALCAAAFNGEVIRIDTLIHASDTTSIGGSAISAEYSWAPDETLIAFSSVIPSRRARDTTAGIVVRHSHSYSADSVLAPRSAIFLVDITRRDWRILTPDSLSVQGSFSWSPNSQRIAFAANLTRDNKEWAANRLQDLWSIGVADRSVRAIVRQPGVDQSPVWSPDGKWIAFLTQGGLMDMSWRSWLSVVSADGQSLSQPGQAFEQENGSTALNVAWGRNSDSLFFQAPFHLTHQLFALPRTGGAAVRISAIDTAVFAHLSVSGAKGRVAYVVSSATSPGNVYVATLRQGLGDARPITDLNPQLRSLSIASPTRILRWRNPRDSLALEGGLLLPPDYHTGTAYPVVTFIEGGPKTMEQLHYNISSFWTYPLLPLAAHGYVIFAPNNRGRSGISDSFRAWGATAGATGSLSVGDIMSGLDSLIRAGIVDSTRMALVGHSYGGYLTALAVGTTTRFRAASRANSTVDILAEMYGSAGDSALSLLMQEQYGWGSPWDSSSARVIRAESPIEHALAVQTPLLIESGLNDPYRNDAYMLHGALVAHHVPNALVLYPRVGHGIADFHEIQMRYDIARRNWDWIEYWMRGKPADWITEAIKP